MGYLVLYVAVTVAGYFIGSALGRRGMVLPFVGKLQTVVIMILVFLMGSRIGDSEEIVASLDSIGLIALVYTLIIMAVTLIAFTCARRLLGFDRYGVRRAGSLTAGADTPAEAAWGAEDPGKPAGGDRGASPRVNKLTIIIVVFVGLGIAAGYLILPDGFMALTGHLLTLTLCVLLVLIGIDIGIEGTIARNFRSAGWRVILFPFVSIAAMMIGAVIAGLLLPMGIQDALCIGSGLGWYSLAPAMLAEYSARVSAISFLHNVLREVVGILLIPLVAGKAGYIESYSLCGSPSMDVCLPVIERATSGDVAVYSFINGAVLSAAVPFLVSLFMNV